VAVRELTCTSNGITEVECHASSSKSLALERAVLAEQREFWKDSSAHAILTPEPVFSASSEHFVKVDVMLAYYGLTLVFIYCRISGNTALDKDIHETVSTQLKKSFARQKWKVPSLPSYPFSHSLLVPW